MADVTTYQIMLMQWLMLPRYCLACCSTWQQWRPIFTISWGPPSLSLQPIPVQAFDHEADSDTPGMPSSLKCHLLPFEAFTKSAGIDASGLPSDLECHHLVVNQWQDIEAPQNVCIISIPSVFDKSLAPPGKHTIHAYVAGGHSSLDYEAHLGCSRVAEQLAVPCSSCYHTPQRCSQAAHVSVQHAIHKHWPHASVRQLFRCPTRPQIFEWLVRELKVSLLSVANEPYDIWKGLDRKSQEYQDLKVC